MDGELRISNLPAVVRPVLITAFRGWNDGGQGATMAAGFLARHWAAERFADIDPENYFDFQATRPQVTLEDGITRRIEWPENEFLHARVESLGRDVILLLGVEPNLRWRTFNALIVGLAQRLGVDLVISLGALLADVPHTRPAPVSGTASTPVLVKQLELEQSRYEGPTGIVGVINQMARAENIPTASLWASMPFYVQRTPNPKGTLAILERLNHSFGFDLTLHDLEVFAARFEAQVASDIESNPEVAGYARRMAEQAEEEAEDEIEIELAPDDELPDAGEMVDELERFLREQRNEGGSTST